MNHPHFNKLFNDRLPLSELNVPPTSAPSERAIVIDQINRLLSAGDGVRAIELAKSEYLASKHISQLTPRTICALADYLNVATLTLKVGAIPPEIFTEAKELAVQNIDRSFIERSWLLIATTEFAATQSYSNQRDTFAILVACDLIERACKLLPALKSRTDLPEALLARHRAASSILRSCCLIAPARRLNGAFSDILTSATREATPHLANFDRTTANYLRGKFEELSFESKAARTYFDKVIQQDSTDQIASVQIAALCARARLNFSVNSNDTLNDYIRAVELTAQFESCLLYKDEILIRIAQTLHPINSHEQNKYLTEAGVNPTSRTAFLAPSNLLDALRLGDTLHR